MAMALGNLAHIRYDKIAECLKYKAMAVHNAMTTQHPAYRAYIDAWNELDTAEVKLLVAISPVNNSTILN